MLQIPLSDLAIAPGHALEWAVRAPSHDFGAARYASYNQEKHFSAALTARAEHATEKNWVAMTFELPGAADLEALERALHGFVTRHEVLRCTFEQLGGDLRCHVIPAERVELDRVDLGSFHSTEATREHLGRRFDATINALSWPLFLMGAVLRDASTTVYMAFDHIVCDGMSIAVAVDEVWTTYRALAAGTTAELPPVGSYIDFGAAQRDRFTGLTAGSPELAYWREFIAGGDFFPRMPLDFGVVDGRLHPAVNQTSTLLDDAGATAFEQACQRRGGKPFMGILASVGMALGEVTGVDTYRGLLPIGERRDLAWRQAFGWFVNTMPIAFPVCARLDFDTVLGGVRAAFTRLIANVDTPFIKAWELLAPEYYGLRMWPYAVNFFSFLDFRKLPGADQHGVTRPRTIPQASHSNTGNMWFHRNQDGLHLNTIFPDTPRGHRAMAEYRGAITRRLHELAGAAAARGAAA